VPAQRTDHRSSVFTLNLDQHGEARLALDQRHHVGVVCSGEQVSLPVPRHGTILGLGRALSDRDRVDDLAQTDLRGPALGLAHLPSAAKLRHEPLPQYAPALNEQAAIDRFVGHLHVLIGRVLALEPPGDLLR